MLGAAVSEGFGLFSGIEGREKLRGERERAMRSMMW